MSITVGGIGATASEGHGTVDDPAGGRVTVGALMVYVYTQFMEEPSQLVYVNVQVFVPVHKGSELGTPAEGVMVLLQLSITVGGVGAVALDGHATVEAPGAGNENTGTETV